MAHNESSPFIYNITFTQIFKKGKKKKALQLFCRSKALALTVWIGIPYSWMKLAEIIYRACQTCKHLSLCICHHLLGVLFITSLRVKFMDSTNHTNKYNVSVNNTTLSFIYNKNSILSGRHVLHQREINNSSSYHWLMKNTPYRSSHSKN